MATWHQMRGRRRNPTPLYHATLWTVLTDPPGGFSSSMRFETEAAALDFLTRAPAHSYILKPGGV